MLLYAHGAQQWASADAAATTYAITGLGFSPKALRFYCMGISSTIDAASQTLTMRRCVGFAKSATERRCAASVSVDNAAAADTATVTANDCVIATVDGAAARDGELDLSSIDADGFTLVVDDAAPADLTVFWEAWGGDDIQAVTIGDIAEPAATGNQSYSATGFHAAQANGEGVIFFAGSAATTVNTGAVSDSSWTTGFATGSSNQAFIVGSSDEASATMDTDHDSNSNACLGMITVAGGATAARAALTAFAEAQFTLNWSARAVTGRDYVYMAIYGGAWQAGGFTIGAATLNATATVSGLPFTPKGVSLISCGASAAGNSAHDFTSLGSGSSTSSRRSMGAMDENGTANAEIDLAIEYDQVLVSPSNAGGVNSAYDINAVNADGMQFIVDVAGGSATSFTGYLMFGDAPFENRGFASNKHNTNLRM